MKEPTLSTQWLLFYVKFYLLAVFFSYSRSVPLKGPRKAAELYGGTNDITNVLFCV